MRAVFVMFSNPRSAADDDAYNEWYEQTHIPAVLELDGFMRATRWRLSSAWPPSGALGDHQYLTMYELDTDDVPAALDGVKRAVAAGRLGNSADVLAPGARSAVFEQLSVIESRGVVQGSGVDHDAGAIKDAADSSRPTTDS